MPVLIYLIPMRIIFLSLITGFLIASCNQESKETPDNGTSELTEQDSVTISCSGIGLVKLSDTRSDLASRFTEQELQDEEHDFDSFRYPVTLVYPRQPKEITVVWEDAQQEKIKKILIWRGDSPYSTKEGLRVGLSLRDLVKLNNFLSIEFTNFYSSLDGYARITSFNGGELEEKYPCLSGELDIARLRGVDKLKLEEFRKQDTVSSSDALLQSMDVLISKIEILAAK